ncbi:MAG: FtsW/RodA/SpoVE family cell cycle protein [Lachnospiraceae bacterium]|nr:FtsW/RodA/SpoVE family cell cycle protein [Lachnospiraceae bacterium]
MAESNALAQNRKASDRKKDSRRVSDSQAELPFRSRYDFLLLAIITGISIFGLIMLYSIGGEASVKSQLKGFGLGFFAILVLSGIKMPFDLLKKRNTYDNLKGRMRLIAEDIFCFPGFVYVVALALQASVFVIGVEHNGAKRWLYVPGLGEFQPVEITKIAIIFFIASIIYERPQDVNVDTKKFFVGLGKTILSVFSFHIIFANVGEYGFVESLCMYGRNVKKNARRFFKTWNGLFWILVYIGIPTVLVGIENMSSAVIVFGIGVLMCAIASKTRAFYIIMIILGIGAIVLALNFSNSYRGGRFEKWFEIENYDLDSYEAANSQPLKGLYCIANGGLTGTGIGKGVQKKTLPMKSNDMIFAVICEELGLVGGAVIVLMFMFLIWRIKVIGSYARSIFETFFCYGVMIHMGLQVVFNIAVVTNTMPNTGISLPFISSGGTATSFQLIEIAVVLLISKSLRHES